MFFQQCDRRFVSAFPPARRGPPPHRASRDVITRGPVFCLLRTIAAECGQKACVASLASLIDDAALRSGRLASRIFCSTRGAFRFGPRRQQEDVRLCPH
ncbi:hypothetical protein CR51_09240 [Caballeronia megalochromosomata]|nr:hypothetical protein CR51_09240 [Caballeronia megalochromosomata]